MVSIPLHLERATTTVMVRFRVTVPVYGISLEFYGSAKSKAQVSNYYFAMDRNPLVRGGGP